MKQFAFSFILLTTLLITGSCKKIVPSNWSNSKMSFKVDGVAKEAKGETNVFALYAKEYEILQVIGNINGSGEEQMGITLNNFHGVGEYTTEEDFLAAYNTPGADATVLGIEGKIKITEYTEGKSIKGEFQFKGQVAIVSPNPDIEGEIKNFTEGRFEAKVTSYSGPIITP